MDYDELWNELSKYWNDIRNDPELRRLLSVQLEFFSPGWWKEARKALYGRKTRKAQKEGQRNDRRQ